MILSDMMVSLLNLIVKLHLDLVVKDSEVIGLLYKSYKENLSIEIIRNTFTVEHKYKAKDHRKEYVNDSKYREKSLYLCYLW